MTSHHNAHATPSPGPNGKWGWDCADCGARGSYRYGSETAAERGAERHNKTATQRDREIHQYLYGPRRRA
jgi:hypothetical protein